MWFRVVLLLLFVRATSNLIRSEGGVARLSDFMPRKGNGVASQGWTSSGFAGSTAVIDNGGVAEAKRQKTLEIDEIRERDGCEPGCVLVKCLDILKRPSRSVTHGQTVDYVSTPWFRRCTFLGCVFISLFLLSSPLLPPFALSLLLRALRCAEIRSLVTYSFLGCETTPGRCGTLSQSPPTA